MYYLNLFLKKYGWVPNLLAILLLAALVSQRVNLELRKYLSVPLSETALTFNTGPRLKSAKVVQKTAYDPITERNLFNSAPPPTAVAEELETPEIAEELEESPLSSKVELLATFVGPHSMATLEIKADRMIAVVVPGDPLIEGATVEAIEPKRVVLRRAGKLEEIKLKEEDTAFTPTMFRAEEAAEEKDEAPEDKESGEAKDGIQEVATGRYVIEERVLQDKLSQLNQVITQARLVPNFTAGQIDGFKIFAIKPNSVFQQLGLTNGDILESVNGVMLDNPTKGLQVFQDLKNQRTFTINLKRRGKKMTLEYEVR